MNKTYFKGLYIFIHVAVPTVHKLAQLSKNEACVADMLVAILATKGSKVIERKVNETQVSKTMFRLLNAAEISVNIRKLF